MWMIVDVRTIKGSNQSKTLSKIMIPYL